MSGIFLPDGFKNLDEQKPELSQVVLQTPEGKVLAFPQVAVALGSPDFINLLAEAVYQRLKNGNMINEKGEFFAPEEPKE